MGARFLLLLIAGSLLVAQSAEASGRITLSAGANSLTYGGKVRLTGALSAHVPADAGQSVTLLADPYPFGDPEEIDFGTTDERGRFSFTDFPELNTRYVAVLADEPTTASRPTTVVAKPRTYLRTGINPYKRRRAYFEIDLEAPCRYGDPVDGPRVRLLHNRFIIYGQRSRRTNARRIASLRVRKPRCVGALQASGKVTVRITRTLLRYRIIFPCFRGQIVAGMGRPSDNAACGRRVFRT